MSGDILSLYEIFYFIFTMTVCDEARIISKLKPGRTRVQAHAADSGYLVFDYRVYVESY